MKTKKRIKKYQGDNSGSETMAPITPNSRQLTNAGKVLRKIFPKAYGMPTNKERAKVPIGPSQPLEPAKKGGSINKTAGKTTTGVVSNYKGYKGPKVKAQVAKVKKAKGKL